MTSDPIAVGIKRIIRDKGLMQKTVARQSGFSEQQFSAMINDRKVIKAIDLYPISRALGVEIGDIYEAGRGCAQ